MGKNTIKNRERKSFDKPARLTQKKKREKTQLTNIRNETRTIPTDPVGVRVQNQSPQDMTLRHAGCFELRAILASGSRVTSAPLLTTYKNFN